MTKLQKRAFLDYEGTGSSLLDPDVSNRSSLLDYEGREPKLIDPGSSESSSSVIPALGATAAVGLPQPVFTGIYVADVTKRVTRDAPNLTKRYKRL